MAKTEIGEVYQSWGLNGHFEEFPKAVLVADVDESEPYEVDQTRIYVDADGTAILATASGCSCWDGDWYAVRYDTVEELLTDLGPKGDAEYTYQPTFAGVEDLTRQVREWQSK